MKTIITLLLSLSGTLLMAGPRCERLMHFMHFTGGDLMTTLGRDLTGHIWTTDLLGSMSTVYFLDDGNVLILPEDRPACRKLHWTLTSDDNQVYLHLISNEGSREFTVAPTCSGLCLSGNGECGDLVLKGELKKVDEHLDFLQTQLVGNWKYHGQRHKRNRCSSFTLNLRESGDFTLALGPDAFHTVRQGYWQLTPDGDYLILYTETYLGGERTYVGEPLAIRAMDFEDLVIDAEGLPRILEQHSGKQPLFLSKEDI